MHADWQLYFFLVAAKLQQKNLNTELGSADSLQFFLKLSRRAGWGVWKKWIQISWKDGGSKGCHVEVFSLIFGVGFSVKNYVRVNLTGIALLLYGGALFFLIAVAQRRVFLCRADHLATTHPKISIFCWCLADNKHFPFCVLLLFLDPGSGMGKIRIRDRG